MIMTILSSAGDQGAKLVAQAKKAADAKNEASQQEETKYDETLNVTANVIDHSDIQLESKPKNE